MTARILLLCGFVLSVLWPVFAVALPPDDYLGDAAIYTGVPSDRPAPNVLLVIDTSRATLGRSAGQKYIPSTVYTSPLNYNVDQIYVADNAGNFAPTRPLGGNTPVLLDDDIANSNPWVTCSVTYDINPNPEVVDNFTLDIQTKLASYGTYSGTGTPKSPNLATDGTCALGPKGAVYATGNYLNYISASTVVNSNSVIIQHSYEFTQRVKGKDVTEVRTRKFELVKELVNAPATAEPGVGIDRSLYWSELPLTDTRPPTYPRIDNTQPYSEANQWLCKDETDKTQSKCDGWVLGANYYLPSGAFKTQRESIYDALVPVIQGASSSVNFGFLKYNPANQGAFLGAHLASYAANPEALITKLPGVFTAATAPAGADYTCTQDTATGLWTDCTDLIRSGPNRPASEALFDAGWYLRAVYPTTNQKVSSALTEQVPTAIANPCGYNHIIYLTNGLPNQDTSPTVGGLGDQDGDNVGTESDEAVYGLGSHYLDDVAYYLHNRADLNGDGETGDVTVHVILAFQNTDALLQRTASNGGGEFYNVFSTEGLSDALQNILANIVSESDTAFVAPVVPASSTNRTISSNRVYLGLFRPQSNEVWHGNLKKYKVDSDQQLIGIHDNPATDEKGDFTYSQSFWGTGTVVIDPGTGTTATKIVGAEENRNLVPETYDPDSEDPNLNKIDEYGGDGGIVDAGGAGGTLTGRDLVSNRRKIITYLTPANSGVSAANPVLLDPADATYLQNQLLPDSSFANNKWSVSNDAILGSTFGIADASAAGVELKNNLVLFLHGYTADGTKKRPWLLGDILHSKPVVFNYSRYKDDYETVTPSGSWVNLTTVNGVQVTQENTTVIFVGANDGMMHAFRDSDGEELWAFVPPALLPDLPELLDSGHEYFVDGAPSLYFHDADGDGNVEAGAGDKVILLFGLHRGGGNAFLTAGDSRGAYYAIDVTDPLKPTFMWEAKGGLGEMGETWSQPRMDRIKDVANTKVVMFVGGGYDNNEDRRWGDTQSFPTSTVATDTTLTTNDGEVPSAVNNYGTSLTGDGQLNPKGRGIFAIEIATLNYDATTKIYTPSYTNSGTLAWSYTNANDTTNMKFSFPTDLRVLDWDGDGFSDRIYAGDTGGQLWRFDLVGTDKTQWDGYVIFKSNPSADGKNGKKMFYKADIARMGEAAYLYFGTGDREHPLNLASNDRLYLVKDKRTRAQWKSLGTAGVLTESNLKDLTDNELQATNDPDVVGAILSELESASNYGWYVKLENAGEKMLAPPVVFFGQVFYTTYAPKTGAMGDCEVGNLGISRLYHLDFKTAEAVYNYDNVKTNPTGTNDTQYDSLAENSRARGENNTVLMKTDRVRTLGEGIPSGIVTLMDASGKVTMMISASNRVGTYSAPDAKLITPVYYMQWNN